MQNNIDVLRILLADERVDPCDSNCLQLACEMNYPEAVGLLLTHEAVDPSADDNKLVIFASPKGLVKIVDILMRDPRVDPSAQGNSALLLAMGAGHYDVAERLLSDRRVSSLPNAEIALHWTQFVAGVNRNV